VDGVRRCVPIVSIVAVMLGAGAPLGAQVTATADVAFGAIEYEGFLGSAALTLTPGLRYDARNFSVAAQGNWVVFESGRTLVQGAAAAAWLTPPVGPLRGEVSGFGGLATYAEAPGSGYGLLRGRIHVVGGAAGAWAGGGVGHSYAGATDIGTSEIAAGGWLVGRGLTVTATLTRGAAADSAFFDYAMSARWQRGILELEGLAGARLASDFDDAGLFGEMQTRLALTRLIAAQVSAGYYRVDPLRGAVAGRWISGGFRVSLWPRRSTVTPPDERLRATVRLPGLIPPDAPELRLTRAAVGVRAITILVPRVASVELAADFTDWQPVRLQPAGRDTWRLDLALAPGVYRLNIRIDGGPWTVPRGATAQVDEFGSVVGLVVVR
jgi:hypothetical protein